MGEKETVNAAEAPAISVKVVWVPAGIPKSLDASFWPIPTPLSWHVCEPPLVRVTTWLALCPTATFPKSTDVGLAVTWEQGACSVPADSGMTRGDFASAPTEYGTTASLVTDGGATAVNVTVSCTEAGGMSWVGHGSGLPDSATEKPSPPPSGPAA